MGACLRAEAESWRCVFPGYVLKYVETPVFVSQHKYDNWVIKNMLGLPWLALKNSASAADLTAIRDFGSTLAESLRAFQQRAGRAGLWLAACELGVHGEIIYHRWLRHRIAGLTLREAFAYWLSGKCPDPSGRCKWVEPCDWTNDYERNLSLVASGQLQKCSFKHQRWEIGTVTEFRPVGSKCDNPTLTKL
eukprot:NODE_2596_length_767_cov_212.895543_g1818_i0.p1 GENE.NODE_2596_length_767_cov_212.895543_g1818_i0~~NODE_2596_length_767_cov_212.895543_g1818_i0.p1  ORF type:complete len:201 (+),score=57.83 NODE_2596_length_767_cov_212.895543_g1818_i0:33-605(+)